ncbi:MAG: hypothetical protein KAH32_04960 [Chlamydiia bacterium]|nr:hypothetical protein [Chlamydiia bacterium]
MDILDYIETNRKIFLSLAIFLGLFVTDRTVNFLSLRAKQDLKEILIYEAGANYRKANDRYEKSLIYTGGIGDLCIMLTLLGETEKLGEYARYIGEFNFRNASIENIDDFHDCLTSLEKIDEGLLAIFYRSKTVGELEHIIKISRHKGSSPLLRYEVFYEAYLAPLYTYIAP